MKSISLVVVITLTLGGAIMPAKQLTDLELWRSFREAVQSGGMSDPERYRPLRPQFLEPMMGYLDQIRTGVDWKQSTTEPEIFRVGDRVHYVVPLVLRDGDTSTFCFTLLLEKERWYFQHLENIFIRLDKIGGPPVSEFPDLGVDQKAWIRDEWQTTKDVRLFSYLAREKGRDVALNWFRDGRGYALAAQVWVPFVTPDRAFILYLCWDLSNLRNEPVVLETLSNEEAQVRFTPRAFALYNQAGHLKQQISLEDYRRLFEVIWQDRAHHGGWNLAISYKGDECLLHFTKADSKSTSGPNPLREAP
jgi:hypothetical protein